MRHFTCENSYCVIVGKWRKWIMDIFGFRCAVCLQPLANYEPKRWKLQGSVEEKTKLGIGRITRQNMVPSEKRTCVDAVWECGMEIMGMREREREQPNDSNYSDAELQGSMVAIGCVYLFCGESRCCGRCRSYTCERDYPESQSLTLPQTKARNSKKWLEP